MTVTIAKTGSNITVTAEYNSRFVAHAKDLGGKWESPCWVFDARDEQRVRDLCRDVYGTDGVTADLVTLRIEWMEDGAAPCAPIGVHGRTIARAYGRDTGAKLGDGIVLLEGGFDSGGSQRNWKTTVDAGTVVLVRDFPAAAAKRLIAKQKETDTRVYSIEEETPVVDRGALAAERERLLARIAEIDGLLSEGAVTR